MLLTATITHRYEGRFSLIGFDIEDILKIIRSFNIKKGHGFDNISIRIIKICDSALVKPLSMIFINCIQSE